MKHVKTPMRVKRGNWAGDLLDADGRNICEMSEEEPFSMAYEIVQVINAHDSLIGACKAQQRALEVLYRVIKSNGGFLTVEKLEVYQDALDKTRAALALTKGDQ